MMAVYNGFPASYQQYNNQQSQPFMRPNQNMNIQNNQMAQQWNHQVVDWVIGEAAAKSYYLQPNTTGYLFDTENDTFYVKVTDGNGTPTQFRVFDYTERQTHGNRFRNMNTDAYVTKADFDALRNDFEAFRREFIPANPLNEGESNG